MGSLFMIPVHGDEPLQITPTSGTIKNPQVTMNGRGDSVIVWQEWNGKDFDIKGLRVDAFFVPQYPVFGINAFKTYNQINPQVAMDSEGKFIVVWESDRQDGNRGGIFAQKFLADGSKSGSEFRVNDFTMDQQSQPTLSINDFGQFFIAWKSNRSSDFREDIVGKRFHFTKGKLSSEMIINQDRAGSQKSPTVALMNSGKALIAWENQSDKKMEIRGQFLGSENQLLWEKDKEISTLSEYNQSQPKITKNVRNEVVIVWKKEGLHSDLKIPTFEIRGLILDYAGKVKNAEWGIGAPHIFNKDHPVIAAYASDRVLAVWQQIEKKGGTSSWFLASQIMKTGGRKVMSTLKLDIPGDRSEMPAIASDGNGNVGLVWSALDPIQKTRVLKFRKFSVDSPT